MKRWLSFALVLCATLLCATPAQAIDPSEVMDGIRDKGVDWLKDKAKDAGEEWVFGTDQSETMQAIIEAAREASNDSAGLYAEGGCRGLAQAQASVVLNNLGMKTTAKNVAHHAFNTMSKVAGLAAGGLGAAAEGGGLAWLAEQYADAAKGAAKDTVMDAIKKAFGKEKIPEFEVYEQSGTVGSGPCTYTLRALWDIVNGNYYVYISGDCKCKTVQSGQAQARAIGKWWITFTGSMVMKIDKEKKDVTFAPVKPPRVDFDAQCACSKKELRRPLPPKGKEPPGTSTGKPGTGTGTASAGDGSSTTPGGGTTTAPPPPPPIPPKGRKVCEPCQGIQDQIDADWTALDAANSDLNDAANDLQSAQARLGSHQGQLEAVKASPKDFTISAAQVQARIDADNADIAAAKAKGAKAGAEVSRLEKELRDLGVKLDDCIKKCGHASSNRKFKNTMFNIGIDRALRKHRKDDRDKEDRRREEERNTSHDEDPWH